MISCQLLHYIVLQYVPCTWNERLWGPIVWALQFLANPVKHNPVLKTDWTI